MLLIREWEWKVEIKEYSIKCVCMCVWWYVLLKVKCLGWKYSKVGCSGRYWICGDGWNVWVLLCCCVFRNWYMFLDIVYYDFMERVWFLFVVYVRVFLDLKM